MYIILITLPVGTRFAYGPFDSKAEADAILDPLLNPPLPSGEAEVIEVSPPARPGSRAGAAVEPA